MKMNYVLEWIKKADADLDTAKTLIEVDSPHTGIIGFHCQQAVEKYTKAYLVFSDIKIPKMHDLDSLLQICIQNNPEFTILNRKKISSLTDYAVDYRYPDDYTEPTLDEVKEYYELSVKIQEFILPRVKKPNKDNKE